MKTKAKALIAVLLIIICIPGISAHSHVFHSNKNSSMKIALTFDDGPHPKYTPEILKILREYNIKATFFVIGENVEYYHEAFEMVLKDGHEIGNHTYSHPHLNGINESKLHQEIEQCHSLLLNKYGYKTKLFRPPEGSLDDIVETLSYNMEYNIILWNVDTLDWKHTPANIIANNIVSNIKSGDIILMHDYISNGSPTPEALKKIIPRLIEHGFQFVTVSELISSE